MELKTIHLRTAKWVDTGWKVCDVLSYYWENKTTRSPSFNTLTDALNWIIAHDQQIEPKDRIG